MFSWLLAVAIAVLIWGALWRRNLVLSFGILLGLLLAWLASVFIRPYVTGMEEIPIWLPPLPLATVAVVLFVYGALVWFRGNEALPKKDDKKHDEHHH